MAGGDTSVLNVMNSQMRRIDLFCKLVSPLAIALVDGISTRVAIQTIFCTNAASVAIEYALVARTYAALPVLALRVRPDDNASLDNGAPPMTSEGTLSSALSPQPQHRCFQTRAHPLEGASQIADLIARLDAMGAH